MKKKAHNYKARRNRAQVWVGQSDAEYHEWLKQYAGGCGVHLQHLAMSTAADIRAAFQLCHVTPDACFADTRREYGVCTKELAMIGQAFSPRMIMVRVFSLVASCDVFGRFV